MIASHDPRLVLVSIVVSILAAYAARELVERVTNARGSAWIAWLVGGATVDGIGTWSMHYTGKLALRLPVPLLLDWPIVLLSLLVSIVGSAGALVLLSRRYVGWPRAVVASILLGGVGISGLHYTAMWAILAPQAHHPGLATVTLSILISIVLSLMAIALAFLSAEHTPNRRLKYHGSVWLRGAANPAMHYVAMAAVIFTYSAVAPDLSHAVSISSLGVLGISVVPVILLVVLLLTALVDRLRKQKEILQKVFDHIPVMISVTDKEGHLELVNREWERKRGWSLKDAQELGPDILAHIYPDPREQQRSRSHLAAASGEWSDFRTIASDGQVMDTAWVVVRLSDETSVNIGQDVTERKRAEEKLQITSEQLRALSARLQ